MFAGFFEFPFEARAESGEGVDHAEVDADGGFPFLMFFGEAGGGEAGVVEPIGVEFFAITKVSRVGDRIIRFEGSSPELRVGGFGEAFQHEADADSGLAASADICHGRGEDLEVGVGSAVVKFRILGG